MPRSNTIPRAGNLSIGDLSRHTGVNIETIRYYERIGLLAAPPRTQGRHRLYDEAHRQRLALYGARAISASPSTIRAISWALLAVATSPAHRDDPPPLLHDHYSRFITTTRQSAPLRRIGTFGLAVGAACAFSLTPARFSRSVPEPDRASRRLHAGCRSGRIMTSPKLIPEVGSTPGFGIT